MDVHITFDPIPVKVVGPIYTRALRMPHIEWGVEVTQKRRSRTMDLVLKDDQRAVLHINPLDDVGKPAKLDGVPVWELEDDGAFFVTVEPAADGLSAVVTATGNQTPVGTQVTLTVLADADLSDGVFGISDVVNITINASQAVSLGLTADPAEHI